MFYGRSRKINFPCVFRNGPENHIFSVPHKKRRNLLNLQRKKPKNHLLNVQRKKPKNQFSQCSMEVVGKLFFRSSNHLFNVRRYPKKCTFSKHTWKHAFPIIPCPKKMHRECNRFICDAGRRTHTIYSNRYHPYYSKQSISHFPSFFFIQSTAW